MFRIDNATAVSIMPDIEAPGPHPGAYFTNGDPDTLTIPTQLDYIFLNAIQEELCNVIELSGGTLSKNDNTQLYTQVQAIIDLDFIDSSGLTKVEDDTDPHLGGDLDLNYYNIFTSEPTMTLLVPGAGYIFFNASYVNAKESIVNEVAQSRINFTSNTLSHALSSLFIGYGGVKFGDTAPENVICEGIIDEDILWPDSTYYSTVTFTQQSGKALVDNRLTDFYDPVINPEYPQHLQAKCQRINIGGGSTNATRGWLNYSVATAADYYSLPMPKSATISELKVRHSGNSMANPMTIELLKNGTATLTITIAASAAAATATATGTVSVSAGDLIAIKYSATGTGANVLLNEVGILLK